MFSQIKLYIYGFVAAAFGLLVVYAQYMAGQKNKYKAESKLNKQKADSADKRIEAHELREDTEQENVNIGESDIDTKLHDYYRD